MKDKNREKKDGIVKKILKSEVFIYIVFGLVATIVNMLVFRLLNLTLPLSETLRFNISQIVAWIVSFFVAFFCNKFFVFKSKSMEAKVFWKEFFGFFTARILSFFVHIGIANFCVLLGLTGDLLIGIQRGGEVLSLITITALLDDISNLLGNVAEIILNYICSKLFIFKNKDKDDKKEKVD
ncbi:MAG: GtrA family protein [Clostridia bacterium]|nr:GtrA family protein [Clostridia bacterium]